MHNVFVRKHVDNRDLLNLSGMPSNLYDSSPFSTKTMNMIIHSSWIGQVTGDVRGIFYQKMIGGRLFYACFNSAFIKNGLLQVCIWFPPKGFLISFLICFLSLRRQRKEENFLSFTKDTKVKDFCIFKIQLHFNFASLQSEIWTKLDAQADQYVALPSVWSCYLVQLIPSIP